MILQNYWVWLKQVWQNVSGSADITGVTGLYYMTGTAITTFPARCKDYLQSCHNLLLAYTTNVATNGNINLALGSGTTDVTATDYTMATDETSNFTITGTVTLNHASNKLEIVFACEVTNTTAADITLTEIGIRKPITANYSSYNLAGYILFARDILDTPITVAAGETKTINYVWTMQ